MCKTRAQAAYQPWTSFIESLLCATVRGEHFHRSITFAFRTSLLVLVYIDTFRKTVALSSEVTFPELQFAQVF